jgi:hypothetical protein
VKPDDTVFSSNLGVIRMASPNYQGLNNGCCGHSCMIYTDKRWRLHFIWRLTTEVVHGYDIITVSPTRVFMNEIVHRLDVGDIIFKFVSVFGFDGTNDPAFINPLDGCLNAGIRPTSAFLPLPTIQPFGKESPGVSLQDNTPRGRQKEHTVDSVEVPLSSNKHHQSKRGRRRYGRTRYPDWLRSKKSGKYISIFMLKSDVARTQLGDLTDPG